MMLAEKQSLLAKLQRASQGDDERLTAGLAAGDYPQDCATKIESLRNLFEIAEKLPVWPFNVRTMRVFLSTIMTPLVPVLRSQLRNQESALWIALRKLQALLSL